MPYSKSHHPKMPQSCWFLTDGKQSLRQRKKRGVWKLKPLRRGDKNRPIVACIFCKVWRASCASTDYCGDYYWHPPVIFRVVRIGLPSRQLHYNGRNCPFDRSRLIGRRRCGCSVTTSQQCGENSVVTAETNNGNNNEKGSQKCNKSEWILFVWA